MSGLTINCCNSEGISENENPTKQKAIIFAKLTALVLFVIGMLALVGLLYPSSPLASLGNAFGPIGTLATMGSGIGLFAITLVANMCGSSEPSHIVNPKGRPTPSQRSTGNSVHDLDNSDVRNPNADSGARKDAGSALKADQKYQNVDFK